MISNRTSIYSLFFLCRFLYLYFPHSIQNDSVEQSERGCACVTHRTVLEPQQLTENEDSKMIDLGLARIPEDDVVKLPAYKRTTI